VDLFVRVCVRVCVCVCVCVSVGFAVDMYGRVSAAAQGTACVCAGVLKILIISHNKSVWRRCRMSALRH